MLVLGIKKHFVLQQGNYIVFFLLSLNLFFLTESICFSVRFNLTPHAAKFLYILAEKASLYCWWEVVSLLETRRKLQEQSAAETKGIPQSLTCLLYVSLGLFKTRCFRPGTIMKWIPANSRFYIVGVNVWDIVQWCPDALTGTEISSIQSVLCRIKFLWLNDGDFELK